jgi:phosphoglycolate phosphatase
MNALPALPKVIFFDWDGTLVDSFAFLEGAHNCVLQSLGLKPLPPGGFSQYFGAEREMIYKSLYGNLSEDAKKSFETYVGAQHHLVRLMPGAQDLMHVLRRLGIRAGVVSNKKSSFIHQEIRNLGWESYFSAVVGAGEATRDKPFADPLLYALEQGGVLESLSDTWYAGDTIMDLECARNARVRGVFIGSEEKAAQAMQGHEMALKFKDCQDFSAFLEAAALRR